MLEPSGGYLNGYELYEDPDRPLLVRRATIELGEMSDHLVWRNIFFCGVKDEFPACDYSRFVLPLIRPPIPIELHARGWKHKNPAQNLDLPRTHLTI